MLARDSAVYDYMPAPRLNPDGRLDGAWIVVRRGYAKQLATRFKTDGRDRCEAWIHRQHERRGLPWLARPADAP